MSWPERSVSIEQHACAPGTWVLRDVDGHLVAYLGADSASEACQEASRRLGFGDVLWCKSNASTADRWIVMDTSEPADDDISGRAAYVILLAILARDGGSTAVTMREMRAAERSGDLFEARVIDTGVGQLVQVSRRGR